MSTSGHKHSDEDVHVPGTKQTLGCRKSCLTPLRGDVGIGTIHTGVPVTTERLTLERGDSQSTAEANLPHFNGHFFGCGQGHWRGKMYASKTPIQHKINSHALEHSPNCFVLSTNQGLCISVIWEPNICKSWDILRWTFTKKQLILILRFKGTGNGCYYKGLRS